MPSPSAAPPEPRTYPFSAVVGSDDMALALVLTTVSPEVGGVLVRGEKGTAKTTTVRALARVLPPLAVVEGCRFSCDPADPDPRCPDGPHPAATASTTRPARLVELPVGATEDRVIGSLDLQQALGAGRVSYEPGLLAAAHRGLLYVDEVNLLHDHLVDLLLDAAATGRSTVEREGVSVAHASRMVLIGTMNPEEGELRPQLLDRFGLTAEVAAPRDPALRAEVVRRRMAFDRDPDAFTARYADDEAELSGRLRTARALLPQVELRDDQLLLIAEVCAAFEVDGMRADLVTARAAVAHAAWHGRTTVTRADIRAAARLALPHRRRRNPFDAPGLDEELLDRLLGEDEPEPEPPQPEDPQPGPDDEGSEPADGSADPAEGTDAGSPAPPSGPGQGADARPPDREPGASSTEPEPEPEPARDQDGPTAAVVPTTLASAGTAYRTRLFTASGVGAGEAGRRSRAVTRTGRSVGAAFRPEPGGRLHLPATIRAAAPQQAARGRAGADVLRLRREDLRTAITEGRESNLVLLVVDASGSMAARRRMEAVKTAALSLLLDAYQRRDKVGLVTFRGSAATLALPPTSSVEVAARRLEELPNGGRTPLAEGLLVAAETLRLERIRDPRRRPLLVLVTDGRATSGPDAVARSRRAADLLRAAGVASVVIDCETGFGLGLARTLALHLGAEHVPVGEVAADQLVSVVHRAAPARPAQPQGRAA
ncbi:VWA domain-containing protein [Microlunatus capsulatus]|uniref:Mg-protoporphyrin IX chelatase n=1 Tax=Microlunatus capsulatus TaxID=99117 RepID=A0ABS4Z7V8_9ACTN|nr:VWA domain-containing protein [Microlunatus capsulatus]MBP2417137.1 magnesium chelatase subunit D [Microlunatus capsulatus]